MTKPWRRFAIPVLTVAACVSIVAAACGGGDDDDPLSPAGNYLTQLSAIITLGNVQLEAIEQQYPTAFQEVGPTHEYYSDYAEASGRFLEAAKQIPVASDVRAEHDEYIAAGEEMSRLIQARSIVVASATTIDEVNAILADDPDYTAAVERQIAACHALATIAAAEDVNVPGLDQCNKLP